MFVAKCFYGFVKCAGLGRVPERRLRPHLLPQPDDGRDELEAPEGIPEVELGGEEASAGQRVEGGERGKGGEEEVEEGQPAQEQQRRVHLWRGQGRRRG